MLEKIIKYQNEAELRFETDKNFRSISNYIIAILLFFSSTIIAAFTFPFRYLFKKVFERKSTTSILHLTSENIEATLKKENLILIDFWAEWCGPCIMMNSIIEKFSTESKNIKVAKVNADLNRKLVQKYNIKGLPQFVLFKKGKEIKRFAGSMTLKDLDKFCKE